MRAHARALLELPLVRELFGFVYRAVAWGLAPLALLVALVRLFETSG